MTVKTDFDLARAQETLTPLSAGARLQWAQATFGGGVVASTSFGIQSALTLHLLHTHAPQVPVVFVDTGYLFPETYQYAELLQERLQLDLRLYTPRQTAAQQEALYGKRWEDGADALAAYNRDNKVEPMNRAMTELGAELWISGLRRAQSQSRAERPVLEAQNRMLKLYPILEWSEKQFYDYMVANDLPFHPLWEKGYVSVGDWHSTAPLTAGMTAEETRFGGAKRECGLHELSGQADWQI